DRTLASLYARLQTLRTHSSPFDAEVPTMGRWTRPGKTDGPITWVKPDLVAQVKYAEITQDGIMRAPVFLGLREDKAARDVTAVEVVPPPAPDADRPHTSDAALAALVEQLQAHSGDKLTLEVEGNAIAFSNLNKIFWPAHGEQRALTKRDLVIYFAR